MDSYSSEGDQQPELGITMANVHKAEPEPT
jgi:hypothetical protein